MAAPTEAQDGDDLVLKSGESEVVDWRRSFRLLVSHFLEPAFIVDALGTITLWNDVANEPKRVPVSKAKEWVHTNWYIPKAIDVYDDEPPADV